MLLRHYSYYRQCGANFACDERCSLYRISIVWFGRLNLGWYACSVNGSPFLHHRRIIRCVCNINSNTRIATLRFKWTGKNERPSVYVYFFPSQFVVAVLVVAAILFGIHIQILWAYCPKVVCPKRMSTLWFNKCFQHNRQLLYLASDSNTTDSSTIQRWLLSIQCKCFEEKRTIEQQDTLEYEISPTRMYHDAFDVLLLHFVAACTGTQCCCAMFSANVVRVVRTHTNDDAYVWHDVGHKTRVRKHELWALTRE